MSHNSHSITSLIGHCFCKVLCAATGQRPHKRHGQDSRVARGCPASPPPPPYSVIYSKTSLCTHVHTQHTHRSDSALKCMGMGYILYLLPPQLHLNIQTISEDLRSLKAEITERRGEEKRTGVGVDG